MKTNTSDITGEQVVGITSLDPILTEDEGVNIWYRNGFIICIMDVVQAFLRVIQNGNTMVSDY